MQEYPKHNLDINFQYNMLTKLYLRIFVLFVTKPMQICRADLMCAEFEKTIYCRAL